MIEKATSIDIAHQAGVSQSTVSRALRDSPLVTKETRDRIKSIAKKLNYKVDKNASNLRTQLSGTIALLLFEEPTEGETHINLFFLSMLSSVTKACAKNGYDLLVSFQQLSNDWHADYEDSHKADGIILLGYGDYTTAYREKLLKLEKQGTHFVRWGDAKGDQPGISIGCNNYTGGFDVTEHLIKVGRKNIAFIGGASSGCPEFMDRYNGSCDALKKAKLEVNPKLQFDAEASEQSGYIAVQGLVNSREKFDAIFCACDLIALGAIKGLREYNLHVPGDIAIVGFDDIPLANFTRPTLTTVQQDTNLAGELLVESVLGLIRNQDVKTTMLSSKLIIRKSCGWKQELTTL